MDSDSGNFPSSTERIRNKLRAEWQERRELQKEAVSDEFRLGLSEIKSMLTELENLNEVDVIKLAGRIKRHRHANQDDMFRLSNAFLVRPENITTFIKIPGALAVLVKDLTGNDAESQIWASEVICNLSLGDAMVCEKIASAAGSYLVTYLDNAELRLKKTSLWVIINIIATGGKGLDILLSQQVLLKLLTIYNIHRSVSSDYEEYLKDVAKCLDLIFSSGIELNMLIDKPDIVDKLFVKQPEDDNSEYHLKYIFDSGILSQEYTLTVDQIEYLLRFVFFNAMSTEDDPDKEDLMKILYAVRVFANLVALYPKQVEYYSNKWNEMHGQNITEIVTKIISFYNTSSVPPKEIFWLIRNLVNFLEVDKPSLDFTILLEVFKDKMTK